jgi:hypothetical protein
MAGCIARLDGLFMQADAVKAEGTHDTWTNLPHTT